MKTIKAVMSGLLLLATQACQAQHLRVIPETSQLARELLTNDTVAQWTTILNFGTNLNFASFATQAGSNNFTGSNTFTGSNVFSNPNNSFTGSFNGSGALTGTFNGSGSLNGTLTGTGSGTFSGTLNGNAFGATNLQSSNLVGVITNTLLPTDVAYQDLPNTFSASDTFTGVVTANNSGNSFSGNGSGLTQLNAGNLATGTVPSGVLPSNLTTTNYAGVVSLGNAANFFNGSFSGNGANITGINPANITSGSFTVTSLNVISAEVITLLHVAAISGNQLATQPTISAGTGAGSGGSLSATMDSSRNNTAFTVTLLTGMSTAASATVFTVSWGIPNHYAAPHVVISPQNAAAAALSGNQQVYVSSTSTTSMTVSVGSTALATNVTYIWSGIAIE